MERFILHSLLFAQSIIIRFLCNQKRELTLGGKIPKPKEFTDAEAEAFVRYLTQTEKRKKSLIELMVEILLRDRELAKQKLKEL